jgi:hypothetical protein
MLSSNMLLPNLILLIDVTFSTPTGDSTQNPANERDGDLSTAIAGGAEFQKRSWAVDFEEKIRDSPNSATSLKWSQGGTH